MWKPLSLALGALSIYPAAWRPSQHPLPAQPLPAEQLHAEIKTITVDRVSTATATLDHVPAWTTAPPLPRPSCSPVASYSDSFSDSSSNSSGSSSGFSAPLGPHAAPAAPIPRALPSPYQPVASPMSDRLTSWVFDKANDFLNTARGVYDFLDQTTITGVELVIYLVVLWCLANIVYLISDHNTRTIMIHIITCKQSRALFLLPTLVIFAQVVWSFYPVVDIQEGALQYLTICDSPEAWAESFSICSLFWMCYVRHEITFKVQARLDELWQLVADIFCQSLVVVYCVTHTILRRIYYWLDNEGITFTINLWITGTQFLTVTLPKFIITILGVFFRVVWYVLTCIPGWLRKTIPSIIRGIPGTISLINNLAWITLKAYYEVLCDAYVGTHNITCATYTRYRASTAHTYISPVFPGLVLLSIKLLCQILWTILVPVGNHLYMRLLQRLPSLTTAADLHHTVEAWSLSLAERKYLLAQQNHFEALRTCTDPAAQDQLRILGERAVALRASLVEAVYQMNYLRRLVVHLTNYAYEHRMFNPLLDSDILARGIFADSPVILHPDHQNPSTGYFFSAQSSSHHHGHHLASVSDHFDRNRRIRADVATRPLRNSIDLFKHHDDHHDDGLHPLHIAFPGFNPPVALDHHDPFAAHEWRWQQQQRTSDAAFGLRKDVVCLEDLAARGEVWKWDFCGGGAGGKMKGIPEERGKKFPWN